MSTGIVPNTGPMAGRRQSRSAPGAAVAGFLIALAALIIVPACSDSDNGDGSTKVNGSVHVAAGKPPLAATTVNGSIHIDDNAAVTNASTVNGSVHLGEHATAKSLESVNGAITLGSGAHLSGDASSVNGELSLADGAEILGSLSNVNGKITLTSAHVAKGIKTVNGGISITGASRVEGGIVVERPGTQLIQISHDVPRIVIGPGATVQGELRFEREVQLYVSDKATIGKVTGATPISFSGDSPPN